MSNKEPSQTVVSQPINYSEYQLRNRDEIDLFELMAQLWKKKLWILGCMFATTLIAGIYAFTAKEQWTATAVINVPTFSTMANYYQGFRLVEGDVDKPTPSEEVSTKLFQQFVSLAASYNEVSRFVQNSSYFKTLSEGMTAQEQSRLLEEIVNNIKFIKDKENPFYTVNFPARTAEQSKKLLTDYMVMVNKNVSNIQYSQLAAQIEGKKQSVGNQMSSLKKIAEEQRQEEIENVKMALTIAEKANIQKPETAGLAKLDNSNMFLLGKDALMAMSDSIAKQPLVLSDKYYGLQGQYMALIGFKAGDENAQAFSYLKSPAEPVTKDKPKRALILVLGALLGGILGAGIVLGKEAIVSAKQSKFVSN
ncbi:LPS O-antigen chain length determinant protein WzzB [Leminorella grimontii]|uniref:LPS O-antigen chain length determinant protein WzzB n=1 Tax=Leminorella grimontii TaxID=82981 RepID=UPI00321FF1DA